MDNETKRRIKFIRINEVRELLGGVSKVTIYEWVKQGFLPKPTKLAKRAAAWREADIIAYCDKIYEQSQRE